MTAAPRLGRYRSRWHRAARSLARRLVLRPVVAATVRVRVEGREHLHGMRGPVVVVANHNSHLDATAVVTCLPARVTGNLAVAAAADYFYCRWWRRAGTALFFNSYPVNRDGRSEGTGMSARLLRAGVSVLIFPEGSRSRDGLMKPFKPGAAALCCAERVPCLPIALLGTREAMPVGRGWPRPGRPRVTMLVGRPMRAGRGEPPEAFSRRVHARVSAMLAARTAFVVDTAPPGGSGPQAGPREEAS